MSKAFSIDLRRRMTTVISGQIPSSCSTSVRLQKRFEETGSLEPKLG